MATSISTGEPTSVIRAADARLQTGRWWALAAVIGPILFTLAWLILGFVSPGFTIFGTQIAPYLPISAPISGLGLGATGFYMNSAFVLTGLLMLIGEIAVFQTIPEMSSRTRWACIVLLAICPL